MSLTINTTSNLNRNTYLLPVYSNIQLNATDPVANNFLFYVNINDVSSYQYSIQNGYNNTTSINLSTILEGVFATDVSLNSANYFSNTNAIKKITWKIISRDISLNNINTYDGLSTTTPLYVYNGVISPDEQPYYRDPLSFFPNPSQGYWLRKHNAPIKILNYVPGNNIADEHWLSSFNGNFGDCSCNITKLQLKSYKFNNSVTTATTNVSLNDKSIWTINVNKTSLNTLFGANIVDINTKYLILQDSSAYLKPVIINLVPQNKVNNPYNLIYVNSLGVPECILFDRVDEKSINIKRSTYGYYLEKVYYADLDRLYSVYSSLMTQEESLSLFDLWISSVVYAENDEFVVPQPVIITNTKMLIANKWNVGKILQYKIDLTCAYRTLIQKT